MNITMLQEFVLKMSREELAKLRTDLEDVGRTLEDEGSHLPDALEDLRGIFAVALGIPGS